MPDFGKALQQLNINDRRRGRAAGGLDSDPSEMPPVQSIAQQLEFLRARHANHPAEHYPILSQGDVLPPGGLEETKFGTHYVVRGVYPHDHFHGKVRLSRFSCSELDQLMSLMRQAGCVAERERIIFLDTETTGMQGGTGICPFLIGLGFFVGDDFHMVQYFIRDFDEEPSMLWAVAELLSRFQLVVTYNGAAFDIPVLEARFTLARFGKPFLHMGHFDLLFTARRLWRNGHGSCRLVALEREIVSFMRGIDVPGSMIPGLYFDFLNHRARDAFRGVFTHNNHDVVSLTALTVSACDRVVGDPAPLDDPLDLYSLARVMENARDWRQSIRFYEMAISGGLPQSTHVKALENLTVACRRCGDHERSRQICLELMNRPQFSMPGYEGAAIYYEKVAGDYEAARSVILAALKRLEESSHPLRWRRRMLFRWDRLRQKVMQFTPSSEIS